MEDDAPPPPPPPPASLGDFEWIELGRRLLIPGFVDGHVHACQYGFMGLGVGLPLLDWLDRYTFPFEARFADTAFARRMYRAARLPKKKKTLPRNNNLIDSQRKRCVAQL